MLAGQFFDRFFSERGSYTPNSQYEASVLCPFPHDKGYETRPSAHVNVKTGLFHCKTCRAEGRFNQGGLSEIGFMAQVYNVSYERAVQMFAELDDAETYDEVTWLRAVDGLLENGTEMQYLLDRGISRDTIIQYRLAYTGDGIRYPVIIYGQLCDIRTYRQNTVPKITSLKGSTPLLFPFDAWRADERPTLLVAGENDVLLARQNGFNALTVTAGEGTFPKMFVGLFKDKDVYVCFDCDEAGKRGARSVAFYLKEAGARVRVVDLKLPGTKEDKDITDFFVHDGKSAADLQALIDSAPVYTPEMFQEDKNEVYPLIDLWDLAEGEYHGKEVSSRVVLAGKYDTVMQAPTAVEWKCNGQRNCNECSGCPLANESGWWTLDKNLEHLMSLVDVTRDKQNAAIRKFCGIPAKCPNSTWKIRARQPIYKAVFTPDVDTEDEISGHRSVEQYAYVVGLQLEDGARYRAFYRPYPHPLDGQRVFMVIDRVEDSDNSLNTFQMTPELKEELKVFQGAPDVKMKEFADRMHDIVRMFKPNEMVSYATIIMYHSPLRFLFNKKEMKGYPEMLVSGESRTGKTETALFFQRHVRIGNFMAVKGATTAGLLGGADKLPSGGFKINWGTIPRNHRGIVILDEMSGMSRDVMASLTSMRSERIATVHKIAKGKAPAETRMLWLSNPRTMENGQSKNVHDYPNGVQLFLDLVGSDEDVARFDACILITKDSNQDSSPMDEPEIPAYPADLNRNLIYWVWSRKSDQIKFDVGVDAYAVHVAKELNDRFDTDVKFLGAEAWKKLVRIAVACAGACFSCDSSGDSLLVCKEHVEWAAGFLTRCYDNPVFRLPEYARLRRAHTETTEAVNAAVAGICRTQPILIKTLLQAMNPMPLQTLQAVSGLEPQDFRTFMNKMSNMTLIDVTNFGVTATRRLRKSVDAYREEFQKSKMLPLNEEGREL